MKRSWFSGCLVLALSLFDSGWLHAYDDLPKNIRIEVLIEKAGYEREAGVSSQFSEKTRQFLTTLDGHEASIFVGERVAEVVAIRRFLIENQYLDYAVQFQNVGTQLRVLPRIRGGFIEVEVTPEISYQTAAGAERRVIRMQKLSSTVSVRNGETIQVGSASAHSDFNRLFYQSERGERLAIFLTPQIMD
jgi:hypothetical protein